METRDDTGVADTAPAAETSGPPRRIADLPTTDRKSTRLNSSHMSISYAVFCLKKKRKPRNQCAPARPERAQERGDPTYALGHQIAYGLIVGESLAHQFLQLRFAWGKLGRAHL